MANRTLLLFDLDGTLLDSAAMILESQRLAFTAIGLPVPSRERGLSIVGLSLREAFVDLVGEHGPVEELAEAYRQSFHGLRTQGAELEKLFPGVKPLLAELAASEPHCLGIATGKSQRGVRAILDSYGWEGMFRVIQTADDAPSKPHPGMIENACRETGIAPARTVMIGDSSFDMKMAKAAGAYAIGVGWGFQGIDTLRETGADEIVEDAEALAAALARFG
ncbi:MAG: HAD-IA family hydrolase [Methylobacterium sp.]|nr:HAD-IA family hydrolase [Methylobacterium sp.]MCA3606603.1 HAD-IA family hydrolase [Methylobacterium sp.]